MGCNSRYALRPEVKNYRLSALGGLLLRSGRIDEAIAQVNEGFAALKEMELATDWAYLALADRPEQALELCSREKGPIAAILTAGIRKFVVLRKLNTTDPEKIETEVSKAMDDYGVHVHAALEKHLPILSTISSVAPMIGSVGTVWGMIILFQDIVSQFGTVNIILAAANGIKLKLLVTVWGLIVGIPAYVAHIYFSTIIGEYMLGVEEASSDLAEAYLDALQPHGDHRSHQAPELVQPPPAEEQKQEIKRVKDRLKKRLKRARGTDEQEP